MTHPRIAALEIDAALAEERAKYKRVVANIAALELQRTSARAQEAMRSTVSGFTYVLAVLVVTFVVWAYATTPPDAAAPESGAVRSRDTSSSTPTPNRTRDDVRGAAPTQWMNVAHHSSSPPAQGAPVLGP